MEPNFGASCSGGECGGEIAGMLRRLPEGDPCCAPLASLHDGDQMNLLSRVFDGLFGAAPTRLAAVPEGVRVYAIGDIHGYADLLDTLAHRIEDDLEQSRPQRPMAVFLGDYIDRGPDSAGVLQRLVDRRFPIPFEHLRGNHEDLMLRALAHPDAMEPWSACGAVETLRSYGLDVGKATSRKGLARLRQAFVERLPEAHLAFVQEAQLTRTIGDYLFVHAGLRPGVAIARQQPADLLWIRDEFLSSDYDFGKTVVHGHTPRRQPENKARRINVDTGAFKWGVLTCVVLEGTQRRFLSTRKVPAPGSRPRALAAGS